MSPPMSFQISVDRTFSAAHQLRLYDGALEPVHGHDWRVTVTVESAALDAIGVVMDFHELQRRLGRIVEPWNGRHLNESPAFQSLNPSAENVARHIAESIGPLPEGVRLYSVEITESPGCRARWAGEVHG